MPSVTTKVLKRGLYKDLKILFKWKYLCITPKQLLHVTQKKSLPKINRYQARILTRINPMQLKPITKMPYKEKESLVVVVFCYV